MIEEIKKELITTDTSVTNAKSNPANTTTNNLFPFKKKNPSLQDILDYIDKLPQQLKQVAFAVQIVLHGKQLGSIIYVTSEDAIDTADKINTYIRLNHILNSWAKITQVEMI